MKTPPLLLGSALLFWGWQTDFLIPGAIMAVVLESSRFIKARWEFSDDDLSRIWTFCAVLFLAAIVYAFASNDGVSNFAGWFEDPNFNSQRQAGETSAQTAIAMFRWLPMVLFLFAAAQTYNTRDTFNLATISLIFRRRLKRAKARGEKPPAMPSVHVAHPYFAVCLLGACASTTHARTFFAGFSVLMVWALWPYRSRRFVYAAWGSALVTALLLGYAGQLGIVQLQRLLNEYNPQWFARWSQRGTDPDRSQTAMGHIGMMKLSGRIVVRLKTPPGQHPPELFHEASYREYHGLSWMAGVPSDDFQPVASEGTSWTLLPGKTNTAAVNIACALPGLRALLPLPAGTMRLEHLPDFVIVSTNSNGAVMAEGAGLVILDALYGPGASLGSPPDTTTDLHVPEREKPALACVISELDLEGQSRKAKLQAVSQFFANNFAYSMWQGFSPRSGTNETVLSRFLLKTRSGHCEYFATATVLLLRELRLPARYAVGYAVHEGSDDSYVVRERDGHAWCQVWNEDTASWEDFDTTPASWIAEESKRASMFQWLSDGWSRIIFEIAKLRWGQTNLRQYLLWGLTPVLLFLLYQIVFRRRNRRRDSSGISYSARFVRPGLDSEFYEVERRLAELGFERQPGESATQWLGRIIDGQKQVELRRILLELLQLHYRHRFDPDGLASTEREALRQRSRECLSMLARLQSTVSR